MKDERAGFWVIQKWQFSQFTQKPSETAHPGICLQQEPKHLLGFPFACTSKTFQTHVCATKEGKKLEHWHASPQPPFPVKIWIHMLICTSTTKKERSLRVFSHLRRITNHQSAAVEVQTQTLPHHHVVLLAGDYWRWGVGACPLREHWVCSLSLSLSFKTTDPFNGCHLQGQPAFVEVSYRTWEEQQKRDPKETEWDQQKKI